MIEQDICHLLPPDYAISELVCEYRVFVPATVLFKYGHSDHLPELKRLACHCDYVMIICRKGDKGRPLRIWDFLRREKMAKIKVTKSVGMLLLGIWLILTGLIPVLKLNFSGFPVIMDVLAIASGVLILLGL